NIYIGRSCRNGRHFGTAFKTGHNAEEHNHNDIGSFTVVLNGHQFFLDPGCEVYTKRTFSSRRYEGEMLNSFGHMVSIVAGKLQSPGRQSHGTFISTDSTDDVDTLIADIAPAYPEAKELVSLKRTFIFNRKEQTLTVRDDVEFTTPQTFETALVSFDDMAISDSTVVVNYQNAAVSATVATEGAGLTFTKGIIDNPNARCPNRIAVKLDMPVQKGAITITFKINK
ncbi:MAG: heparinase II/III family protein, partial [Victivallales bacterium]|nr:heparinase II/III family protein [Victivallales bacterium]